MRGVPRSYISRLVCQQCGRTRDIPRRTGHRRAVGHRKPMHCSRCGRVTMHREGGEHG